MIYEWQPTNTPAAPAAQPTAAQAGLDIVEPDRRRMLRIEQHRRGK